MDLKTPVIDLSDERKMNAFKKTMDDLTWMLSSSDKTPDGRDITIAGVRGAAYLSLNAVHPTDIQTCMDVFVNAVLDGARYAHEYECFKLVRTIMKSLIEKGAVFPIDKMFEFQNRRTVEESIQDFRARVVLMFVSENNLEWTRNVEAVYWEDVMDESPTKELLMRCLKWYVDKYSELLLW